MQKFEIDIQDNQKICICTYILNKTQVESVQLVVGCGGVWWLRPILVFSLSQSQAEQILFICGEGSLTDHIGSQVKMGLIRIKYIFNAPLSPV